MTRQIILRALTKVQTLTRSLCTLSTTSDAALKNVTKSNFEPVLADLRRIMREADFVSIDLEMTGLTSAPWRECFEFDRPDIQYLKVKDSAEKFAVVQFGVCPFRWDQHNNSFVAYPHNFYIFPRQEIQGEGLSYEFLCQTSSMEFLAKYQFDFNACIYEGISYLSRRQEEEALSRLDSVYKDELVDPSSDLREVADMELVRMADILYAERMKNKISDWRAGLLSERNGGSDFQESSGVMNQQFQTTFFKLRPALAVNGLTSRQLRLIKSVTEKHFKDLAYVLVTGEPSGLQPLIVYTDSISDRDTLMTEVKACRRKEAEMKIKAAVGFRHVLDLLSSERKLIVGHNCFLDLAHIYSKFFGPLPLTAEDFVSVVHKYFPNIIDTKVMLNSDDVLSRIMKRGSTSLSKAFRLLCSQIPATLTSSSLPNAPQVKVEVQVDDQRFSNWNSGAKHEAGYDAFMTGSVFAQACCRLGITFSPDIPTVDLLHDEKIQKYVNHLYLSWVNENIIDMKTGKIAAESLSSTSIKRQNLNIIFPNMVLLWGLTSKLGAKEFRNCLLKVYGADSVSSLYHLDDTTAFIQFSKAELVSKFLELKDDLERVNDPITVLHPLSKLLEPGCIRAASYETYKEICRSPISEVLFTDQVEAVGLKLKKRPVELIKRQEEHEEYRDSEVLDSLYPVEAQTSK